MKDIVISDAVKYIGADDKDLDLFESQYIVPNGVSYNSYVILDEKVARLQLKRFNAQLSTLTQEQADYIGVPVTGPFKGENYRY